MTNGNDVASIRTLADFGLQDLDDAYSTDTAETGSGRLHDQHGHDQLAHDVVNAKFHTVALRGIALQMCCGAGLEEKCSAMHELVSCKMIPEKTVEVCYQLLWL